jgi:hypothetical protein
VDGLCNDVEPQIVQPHRRFQQCFGGFARRRVHRRRLVLGRHSRHGEARQVAPTFEIAACYQLACRMGGEPIAAFGDELVDLVVAHPVVLILVEHRYQDIELIESIGEATGPIQFDRDEA